MKHAVCSLSLRTGRRCQREAWVFETESDRGGGSLRGSYLPLEISDFSEQNSRKDGSNSASAID